MDWIIGIIFDKNIDIYVKSIYNLFIIKLDIHEIFKI